MNPQWAALFRETKKASHRTKTLNTCNPLEEHKEIYFVCVTCLNNQRPFMQIKMARNNASTITRHEQRHHTDGSKSWVVPSNSTVAQPFIKSNNNELGLNAETYEGSEFESETDNCPDQTGKEKNTEHEPPSKMQKVNTTNSEVSTACLNEQRAKQVKWQSCLSIQKKTNTAIPNEQSNMENVMIMLEKILISVDANRKTDNVNVQSDPDFKKYDFKSYSDISEIAANVDDIVFIPAGNIHFIYF